MEINEYTLRIKKLGACGEAIKAAHSYQTSQALWADCKRGDWMLWLIGKLSGKPWCHKRKQLVLTACKCARLALPYVEKGELRPLKTIETAEQWARGENGVTLDDVIHATYVTANTYVGYTTNATANAAAVAAASAAYTTYATNTAYAAYAAKKEILAQCSDIIRTDYPNVDELWE